MDETRTKQGEKAVNEKPVDESAFVFLSAENSDCRELEACQICVARMSERFEHIFVSSRGKKWHARRECFGLKHARTIQEVDRCSVWERVYEVGRLEPHRRVAEHEVQSSRGPEDKPRLPAGRLGVWPADEQGEEGLPSMPSSAGDKYRVTLINVSGVEHWFDPRQAPTPSKKKSILLVPCARHIPGRGVRSSSSES